MCCIWLVAGDWDWECPRHAHLSHPVPHPLVSFLTLSSPPSPSSPTVSSPSQTELALEVVPNYFSFRYGDITRSMAAEISVI